MGTYPGASAPFSVETSVKAHRFPVKRIAVTAPPEDWFHGISRATFDIYRGALAELGFEIFDVPVDAFQVPDAARIGRLLSNLKEFRPELAIGLPKGSYALICRLPTGRDGWGPNLFTEVLDIPTICLWDHAPLELADQLLAPHPAIPSGSVAGAREALRRSLTHPRLIHWSPDTGQTGIMEELGFLLPNHVIQESLPLLSGMLPAAAPSDLNGSSASVGFLGHFYKEQACANPALEALVHSVIHQWITASGRPLWRRLAEHLASMDPISRRRWALDPDQTYFWHFAHRLILHRAQTALRLHVLGSAGVPITVYGNLNELPSIPRNLTPAPGHIPFGPEIAAALTRHPLTIDVFNPGSIHGYSHKPLMTFAAGGFMLVNRRRDFIDAFGEAGEAVCYDDGDLSAKVDRFLTNPRRLAEVREAIRETIFARFQLKDVLVRVLDAAFRCTEFAPTDSTPPRQPLLPTESAVMANLLATIRSDADWAGTSVRHGDGTATIVAPEEWGYAAAIQIPASVKAMHEPHLRLKFLVETGRIGVAALLEEMQHSAPSSLSAPVQVRSASSLSCRARESRG